MAYSQYENKNIIESARFTLNELSKEKVRAEILLLKIVNNKMKWCFITLFLTALGIGYNLFSISRERPLDSFAIKDLANPLTIVCLGSITFSAFKLVENQNTANFLSHQIKEASNIEEELSQEISNY